jgi:glutaminyl-peptide cyclotransferase
MKKFTIYLLAIVLCWSCTGNTDTPEETVTSGTNSGLAAPAVLQAAVMAEYPHDTAAFTEGMQVHQGKMYEGTGELKRSFIQITDIKTGKVLEKHLIKDSSIFGEGINILGNKLYQLTYQNHVAYVYDLKDLSKPIKTFPWQSEGWGMTNNGTELIISDGQPSGNLYFVNPADFRITRVVQVRDNFGVLENINELEYINGYVYANIWGTTQIIKIDPSNGHVVGKLETADLLRTFYMTYPIRHMDNVLNGIAWDSTSKKMYITGKRWPKLFELQMN